MQRNDFLIHQCHDTWMSGGPFRLRRRRFKDFAYGRQWADTFRTPEGRVLSEREVFEESGRSPVTNNLIRQTIKSVIGRYRRLIASQESPGTPDGTSEARIALADALGCNEMLERDCRALEEFLISGCVVQRIGPVPGNLSAVVTNVSPERFFFHRFLTPDGSDCRLMGMLHDVPLHEVIRTFAHNSAEAAETELIYRNARAGVGAIVDEAPEIDFYAPELPDHVRVIEVWRKTSSTFAWLHDKSLCRYYLLENKEKAKSFASKLYCSRTSYRHHSIERDFAKRFDCITFPADFWVQTFLTPGGVVLGSEVHPAATPPFALALYPMIDGEVHSFVEDVIDQQKYINRLVTLLDDIIASSAKGVLLFPSDQLPEGFTWREMRRLWANPNGVLPYKRTHGDAAPRQINTGGTSAGASEMLRLQLQLFDEISGTSGAMRGSASSVRGAEVLRAETESATTCVLDILAAFGNFTARRDRLLSSRMKAANRP